LLVLGAGATLALLAGPAGAVASSPTYVALGDSYPAGPGTGEPAPERPADCVVGSGGYPYLVAAALGLSLQNVTCSGASRLDFTGAQHEDQPPQFGALSAATEVVTVSMGGNDNGLYSGIVSTCTHTDEGHGGVRTPFCKKQIASAANSAIKGDTGPYTEALAQIRVLAPDAKVFVVGYPDFFPRTGSCYATLPWTAGDDHWASSVNKKLDAELRHAAQADRYTCVDTYAASAGHDPCQPLGTRWIEPLIAPADGVTLHPNGLGHEHFALLVEQAMRAAGVP
jgi:hypothetical protein